MLKAAIQKFFVESTQQLTKIPNFQQITCLQGNEFNYVADFKLLSKTQSNDLDFENSAYDYFTLDAFN